MEPFSRLPGRTERYYSGRHKRRESSRGKTAELDPTRPIADRGIDTTTPALHVSCGIHTQTSFHLLHQRVNFSSMMISSQRAMLRFLKNPCRQPLSFMIHYQRPQGMFESHSRMGSRMGPRHAAKDEAPLIPWTTSWVRMRTLTWMDLSATMTEQATWRGSMGTAKGPTTTLIALMIIVESGERRTERGSPSYINPFSQEAHRGEAIGGIYVSILRTSRSIYLD